jgi:hypothetical protein
MSSPDDNNNLERKRRKVDGITPEVDGIPPEVDAPLSWLEFIPEDYPYTHTFEDGSETTMNLGQDIHMWTQAANKTRASDTRTRARGYLNRMREASIRYIEKAIDEAGDSDDDRLLKENCRALLKKIPASYVEEETKVKVRKVKGELKPEERFAMYCAHGVRAWVRNTLRGMTNDGALARLTGIGQAHTYTPEGGSTLNMGQDVNMWKGVAREETASANREQKRGWLTRIREVLVAELNSVIADETVDAAADAAAFKARCSSLLGRIPDPYWKKR